ncbi:MAG: T9SS type A sorting domain-containing protein [Bacteroidales bacterium]|nr:T9SS type A sorting domain-containing protein [Bacteroidales bacterium]
MRNFLFYMLLTTGIMALANPLLSQKYIADYTVAKEGILRSIPSEFINKARTELVIAYQHTSHGTHVSRGVFGLQDYKAGDKQLFGVSSSPDAVKLEFRDYALENYAPSGVDGSDLSRDETAFIQTTRNYLDAPENATVNVVMWSWCNIAGHDAAGNYLPGMSTLISEYSPGGSKIGTSGGQREVPVTFIYMTGHANKNANTGSLNPMDQADLITSHCKANHQFCLDYYSIDTHAMDDNYYEDTGDNGDSDSYGGNFYEDWQNSHTLGEHYFENKRTPGGSVEFGEHNTQHITANRKAYALWWILSRIAGWEDGTSSVEPTEDDDSLISDISIYMGSDYIRVGTSGIFDTGDIRLFDLQGRRLESIKIKGNNTVINASSLSAGTYILLVSKDHKTESRKVILIR